MYEIVEGFHRALHTNSTWVFVLACFVLFGAIGAVLGIIVDMGYKNSAEYREEHKPAQAHTKSFIQIEKPDILQQYSVLAPGKQWGGNIHSSKVGPDRLFNVFGYSKAYVETAGELSDSEVLTKFGNTVEKLRAEYLSGQIQGKPEVGGEGPWGTVLTDPLTEVQVRGITDGTVRIYFLSWAIWKDGEGTVDTAFECLWLQPLPNRPYPKREIVWHFCDGTLKL